jgi:hypothetical protein
LVVELFPVIFDEYFNGTAHGFRTAVMFLGRVSIMSVPRMWLAERRGG